MKKQNPFLWFLSLLCVALMVSACSQDNEQDILPQDDSLQTALADAVDGHTFDLNWELIAGEVDGFERQLSESNGRITQDCPSVTVDRNGRRITLDFGDGCEGADGKMRSGSIEITYDGSPVGIGFRQRSMSLINYMVDDIRLEGTRTATISGMPGEGRWSETISLVDGKMYLPDGKEISRSAEWQRSTALNIGQGRGREVLLTGQANGVNRAGNVYQVEIIEPLIFTSECRDLGFPFPGSGINRYLVQTNVSFVIDYGDGTCDGQARVITEDGRTITITLGNSGDR